MMIMKCFCVVFFNLIFFIKAYVVGTHLNCINKSVQFKWVPTTYAFIKKNRNVVGSLMNCIDLNCIDKSMQFKWVPTKYMYAFIKK